MDVVWPAILRADEEIDIVLVRSEDAWRRDTDLSGYDEPGTLVDSRGRVFRFVFHSNSRISIFFGGRRGYQEPVFQKRTMSAEELCNFVRPYLSAIGNPALSALEAISRADETSDIPTRIVQLIESL